MSQPECKTIDLDTWNEACRRREVGQSLHIPDEPIERRSIHTDTPGQLLGREIDRQIDFRLRMLPFALALLGVAGLILLFAFLLF